MLILETARLVIRQFEYADSDFIVELLNDPSFIHNIEDKGVRTRAQAAVFLTAGPMSSYRTHGHGLYLVALKETGQRIGMCGLLKRKHLLNIDLGYAFLPGFCGLGYAREAAAGVLAYGRQTLGMRRASAIVQPTNERSIALLTKLGFAFAEWLPMPDRPGAIALYECNMEQCVNQ